MRIRKWLGKSLLVDVIYLTLEIIILYTTLLVVMLVGLLVSLRETFQMQVLTPVCYLMRWLRCTIRKKITKERA